MRLRDLRACFALTLLSPVAAAQTVTWLSPERFTTRAGSDCPVRWESTDPHGRSYGEWTDSDISWLFLRNGGSQRNFGDRSFESQTFQAERIAQLTIAGPGVAMVGIDRAERIESVSSKELSSFLSQRVAPGSYPDLVPQPTVSAPLNVRRIESAKLLLGVIDDTGRVQPSPVASSKAGQPCEIRPLLDPTRGPFGGDLPLRVYLPGGSAGVRVLATHVATGRVQESTTDPDGLGHFRLSAAGVWRVEAHRAIYATASSIPEWEIQSATLTFDVPGPRGASDDAGEGQPERDLKGDH